MPQRSSVNCWVECSKNVNKIELVGSIVQVFYGFSGFLFIGCINYYLRNVEIANYMDLFFFLFIVERGKGREKERKRNTDVQEKP